MENSSAPKECCLFVCCYVTVNKKSLSGIDFSSLEKVLKFAFLTKNNFCLYLIFIAIIWPFSTKATILRIKIKLKKSVQQYMFIC